MIWILSFFGYFLKLFKCPCDCPLSGRSLPVFQQRICTLIVFVDKNHCKIKCPINYAFISFTPISMVSVELFMLIFCLWSLSNIPHTHPKRLDSSNVASQIWSISKHSKQPPFYHINTHFPKKETDRSYHVDIKWLWRTSFSCLDLIFYSCCQERNDCLDVGSWSLTEE